MANEAVSAEGLKEWRKRHGLTQTELASELGVQENTVWRWESGESSVPPFLYLALAELERIIGDRKSKRRRKQN